MKTTDYIGIMLVILVLFLSLTQATRVMTDQKIDYYREIFKSPYVMSFECNSYTTERQCKDFTSVTINATGHYCNGVLICKNKWIKGTR